MIKTIERSYVFDNGVCVKIKRFWIPQKQIGKLDYEARVFSAIKKKPLCYYVSCSSFDEAFNSIVAKYNEDIKTFLIGV